MPTVRVAELTLLEERKRWKASDRARAALACHHLLVFRTEDTTHITTVKVTN
jgi:hypothetical protein